jgi:hypothetical protein
MKTLNKERWPYSVTVNLKESDMGTYHQEQWLAQNLGVFAGQWYPVYYYDRTVFYFKTSQDATVFALRFT